MEQEILDLKITNRAKDQVIDHFRAERKDIIDQLLNASRRVGELETKVFQFSPPDSGSPTVVREAEAGDTATST